MSKDLALVLQPQRNVKQSSNFHLHICPSVEDLCELAVNRGKMPPKPAVNDARISNVTFVAFRPVADPLYSVNRGALLRAHKGVRDHVLRTLRNLDDE